VGAETSIGWTDHTFNPWWGCTRISPGCDHCYAETFSRRVGHGGRLPMIWGPGSERKFFGEKHWAEPHAWNAAAARAGVRRRVFCSSMADVFEPGRDRVGALMSEARGRLWRLIEQTKHLDWLLLTKRPAMVRRFAPWSAASWPSNVWLGVTVENVKAAADRLPILRTIPAPLHFVSYEPALELVDFRQHLTWLDWIIVGGESGAGARPFELAWARSVVDQCRTLGVPVFVKQLGSAPREEYFAAGDELRLRHRKGEDPAEWPLGLRVQEVPASPAAATPANQLSIAASRVERGGHRIVDAVDNFARAIAKIGGAL